MTHEIVSGPEVDNMELFKRQSLELWAARVQQLTYSGYPSFQDRLRSPDRLVDLPSGPWQVSEDPLPTPSEQAVFRSDGLRVDSLGRPLHPWFDEMITNPQIGVVTGKGFYWQWGPNYAADPIVIRRDLDEPHVLLIERGDGTGWALPGGFINSDETGQQAALREAAEETGLDLTRFDFTVKPIYKGPLVDIRATAHAWPETEAYCFELELDNQRSQKQLIEMMSANRHHRLIRSLGRFVFSEQLSRRPWPGSDDAKSAAWVPVSRLGDRLFGSHLLLIQQALQE